jgi:transposase
LAGRDPRFDDRAGEKGGAGIGANPADRGRPACKIHLVCDGRGAPLASRVGPANEHDRGQAIAVVDQIPLLRRGRRPRPDRLLADRGYDAQHIRDSLLEREIEPSIAKKRRPGQGRARDPLSRERWPVERTNAWLHNYRRVDVRWERRPELYHAFVQLAEALILCRRLDGAF